MRRVLRDLRFHSEHQHVRLRGGVADVAGGVFPEVGLMGMQRGFVWVGDPDALGRDAVGEQPADQTARHVAAADEGNVVVLHISGNSHDWKSGNGQKVITLRARARRLTAYADARRTMRSPPAPGSPLPR